MVPDDCFTWIPHLLCQFFSFATFNRRVVGPLPDDILENILSRLPANSVLQCRRVCKHWRELTSSRYFLELQNKRAPTFILAHSYKHFEDNPQLQLSIFDKNAKKLKKIHFKPEVDMKKHNPKLVGSCGSLLLFEPTGLKLGSHYIVLNLITQEQRFIYQPGCHVCGIYFHPATNEHRLLLVQLTGFKYFVYCFESHSTREITTLGCRPLCETSPSIVNHDLHWILDYTDMMEIGVGVCNHAIIVFKMDSEKFSTLPHPKGIICPTCRNHKYMQLYAKDEQLCLFYMPRGNGKIRIWILEDYANLYWVKRYNIDVNAERYFGGSTFYCRGNMKIVSFQEDELLIDWFGRKFYLYDLTQKTTKNIDVPGRHEGHFLHTWVNYTSSIATPGFFPSPRFK